MNSLVVTRKQAREGKGVKTAVQDRRGKYMTVVVPLDDHPKNGATIELPSVGGRIPDPRSIRLRVPNWWVRNGVAAFPVVAGIVGYAWRYVIVFAVMWGFFSFCSMYSRMHSVDLMGSFWHKLRLFAARSALIYLVVAEIAIGFFLFLALIVTRFRGVLSIGQLRSVHNLLSAYSNFWDQWIKLEDIWLLVVYIAVWALTSLLLLWRGESQANRPGGNGGAAWRYMLAKGVRRVVDIHSHYSGPVSVMLAILASFTFFSAAIVPIADQLHSQLVLRLSQRENQLRMQEADYARDYKRAVQQVAADLNAQVIAGLNTRIQESMPSSYRKVLSEDRFQKQVDKINTAASHLGMPLRKIDPDAVRALAAENAHTQRLQDLLDQSFAPSPDGAVPVAVPDDVTARQAAAAREWAKSDAGDDTVELLDESGKQVTLQMGTTFGSGPFWDHVKKVFKSRFPLAEPMVDILSSTVGDQLQEAVYEKVGPIVEHLVNRTGNVQEQISAAARNISAKVNIASLVRAHAAEAVKLAAAREADLARLTNDANQVAHRAKIVQERARLMQKAVQEENRLIKKAVIDPVYPEFAPAGGDIIARDDFEPGLTEILDSNELVQAKVVDELVALSQASNSELVQLWQSYNMQVDSTGELITGQMEGGAQIVTDPVTLKHNAAHVIQYLAPDLPGIVTSEDLAIADDNCGCS